MRRKRISPLLIIGILLLVGVGAYLLLDKGEDVASLGSGEINIYYPLFASIGCEEVGANDWVASTVLSSDNTEIHWTCPGGTTQCRLSEPNIECPFGYGGVYRLDITLPNEYVFNFYRFPLGIASNPVPPNTEFVKGSTLKYQAGCVTLAGFLLPSPFNWYFLFNLATAPKSSNLNIQHINTHLMVYPAMEGKYNIPNTALCNQGGVTLNLKRNEPAKGFEALVTSAANVVRNLPIGIDPINPRDNIPQGSSSTGLWLQDAPSSLVPGNYYRTIDKWTILPGFGNLNPQGQYEGKDVVCSLGSGLIEVKEVRTVGGITYVAPISRLTLPTSGQFCCHHAECLGANNGCSFGEYVCKADAVKHCPSGSDLECQPSGGIIGDGNCYYIEGQAYRWSSACVNFKCVEIHKPEPVACCPSECAKYGKVCDFTRGCLDVIPPNQPCPPGRCCNKDNVYGFFEAECAKGLECCDEDGGLGFCKVVCDPSKQKCANCWAWLKDKMGIEQECELTFWRKAWHNLKCPFYFLKFGILLIGSVFALLFTQQFTTKFKIPLGVTWLLGLIVAAMVFMIGYMYLTWYFIIPLLVILIVATIIVNMIPGGSTAVRYIGTSTRRATRRRKKR